MHAIFQPISSFYFQIITSADLYVWQTGIVGHVYWLTLFKQSVSMTGEGGLANHHTNINSSICYSYMVFSRVND